MNIVEISECVEPFYIHFMQQDTECVMEKNIQIKSTEGNTHTYTLAHINIYTHTSQF